MNDPDSKTAIEEERREAFASDVEAQLGIYDCFSLGGKTYLKKDDWFVLLDDFGYDEALKMAIDIIWKELAKDNAEQQQDYNPNWW